ncbi:MAG TPA: anti-sigma regulatory factor [Negativicutes bacterium]|nr:anti-sigma regulatory factor [Negativicutes bacterium]
MDDRQGELSIGRESDVIVVRQTVRKITKLLGMGLTDTTRVVTAASELARNIFLYAESGVMRWNVIDTPSCQGIELVFVDQGPGIPDIGQAMQEGYTTSKGLGMGLPGSRRLVDEMEIVSAVGKGTTVTIKKWNRRS